MGWRLAGALQVLRAECNAAAPGRSKAADGTIGDSAHAASRSDHNPNQAGVVCALDVTHDPDNGADCHVWAEQVRSSGHPAFKYVIFAGRIASRSRGGEWRPYTGSNPHRSHMHVSVGEGGDGRSTGPVDDTSAWGIINLGDVPVVQPEAPVQDAAPTDDGSRPAPPFPLPDGSYFGPQGGPDESVSGYHSHREDLRAWQQRMADRRWSITADGFYGRKGDTEPSQSETGRVAMAFQTEKGLVVDGLIGPNTWRAAWELPIT